MKRTSTRETKLWFARMIHCWSIVLLVVPIALVNAEEFVIKGQALGDEIKITASSNFGGAIISLVFRGKEFIDAADNGRELQSASTFDGLNECFNPTEAGGAYDEYGTSSSKVLKAKVLGSVLETQTNMAFWRRPGEKQPGGCGKQNNLQVAQNTKILSDHLISKRVEIGCCGIPNAISYDVTYDLPEHHAQARFEAVSLHTPPEFKLVYSYDKANNKFRRTDEKNIEKTQPIIFSTGDGKSAIGLYCPNAKNDRERTAFYGFKLWPQTSVVRCMFLEEPLNRRQYSYHGFIFVGQLEEVEGAMQRLVQQTKPNSGSH